MFAQAYVFYWDFWGIQCVENSMYNAMVGPLSANAMFNLYKIIKFQQTKKPQMTFEIFQAQFLLSI